MVQNSSWCPRCGAAVVTEETSTGNAISETGRCTFCGEKYNPSNLDTIQTCSIGGRVPAVDLLHANRMIGRSPTDVSLLKELRSQVVVQDNGIEVIPLSAVRGCAERNGLTLVPLPPNAVPVWVVPNSKSTV